MVASADDIESLCLILNGNLKESCSSTGGKDLPPHPAELEVALPPSYSAYLSNFSDFFCVGVGVGVSEIRSS